MVTVKGYMGFLEIAAALKFLSNADLVWKTGLLSRGAFLAVWFGVLAMAGLYLLGWLRLPHDAGGRIGPMRRTLGVVTLVVGVLLLGGINGRSMGWFAGLLPPEKEAGWVENYEEGLRLARENGRPLFIDFTGVTCSNCRLMEEQVFTRPEVREEFRNFVTVRLFTDQETRESEGNQKMQLDRFGQTTLPLYVVLDPAERKLGEREYNLDAPAFVRFLQDARARASQVASR